MNSYKIITGIFFISITLSWGPLSAQVSGCTDPQANNYNPAATLNDGSCQYNNVSITPVSSANLPAEITETSGLIRWGDQLWTHNDNTDINLYALDTATGTIIQTYALDSVVNHDWEEISQDSSYIYVGDFGNNASGNRSDLHILRVEKNSLLLHAPLIDTIWFSYADQTDFTPTGANNTDFDCEAFIVSADSIYLFTKQWVSTKTKIYALPKVPGNYTASLDATCNVQGLITGAAYLESRRLLVLCGYSKTLQPFLYLLYDFSDHHFTDGNKRKVGVSLPFYQTEGIATTNGWKYFVSNEQFVNPPLINVQQQFHVFNLLTLLGTYLGNQDAGTGQTKTTGPATVFPNPANDCINIRTGSDQHNQKFIIYNSSGKPVISGRLCGKQTAIRITKLAPGTYYFCISGEKAQAFSVVRN
jgi:hypothetical protein